MSEHVVGVKVYVLVFLALIVGTVLTVGAALVDLSAFGWNWNPVVALAIATTKAILVVLFFMHVKYSSRLTKLTVFLGVFFFGIMITLTVADYISRAWLAQ